MKAFFYNLAVDKYPLILTFPFKILLWILSMGYAFALWIRSVGYQCGFLSRRQLPKRVISVGNLTWGGAGKTPFVIFLAEYLRGARKDVAILSRGYGPNAQGTGNDEVKMLEGYLKDIPVIVSANRHEAASEFLKDHPVDVFLLDDGFQHRTLKRDLDIVLVDATNPWGNGCLLPCGILRESKSALERANIVVLTKVNLVTEGLLKLTYDIKRICPQALIIQAVHKPVEFHDFINDRREDLKSLANQKVNVLCSIARPPSLQQTLEKINIFVEESFHFMDHHEYSLDDVKGVIARSKKRNISCLVTTAKDKVKLKQYLDEFTREKINLLSLEIKIEIIDGRKELTERINHLF